MAVTITDQRTIINEADATTSWTGSNTVTLYTAQPTGVESTGCLGMVVSNATQNAYFTIASTDLSAGVLIYLWIFHRAELDTRANGGLMIQLGDGTDRIGFHVGGSDVDGFRHSNGPVGWQCLVLDTANLPASTTVFTGSLVNLTMTAITQIGVGFKTLVKAVGGVDNCFWDISRRGSIGQGLLVTAGTAGAPGKFSEMATEDRNTGNQRAHGVIRELGTGLYGIQGPITFGDTAGTTATYFADTSVSAVFESRGLGTNKYLVTVQGNSTGSTTFKLGTKSGAGDAATGINGCSITVPSGVGGAFTASDADLQYLLIYGSTLSGFSAGITLSSNATNGPNHEFMGNTVASCGVVDPGRVVVRNCRFTGWTGASTDASLLWGANTNVKRCSFTSSGTGHAIKITATGTYTFDALTFSGYGSTGTTDAVIYNNSGGAVTVNVAGGGDTPTYRNGSGATTTVNSTVSVTLTGLKDNTEIRVFTTGTGTELAGIENATTGTTDNREFTFSLAAGTDVDIHILNVTYETVRLLAYEVPTADTDVPIQQQFDRVYTGSVVEVAAPDDYIVLWDAGEPSGVVHAGDFAYELLNVSEYGPGGYDFAQNETNPYYVASAWGRGAIEADWTASGGSSPQDFVAKYDVNHIGGFVESGADLTEVIDLDGTVDFTDDSGGDGGPPTRVLDTDISRYVINFDGDGQHRQTPVNNALPGGASAWTIVAEVKLTARPDSDETATNPEVIDAIFRSTNGSAGGLHVRRNGANDEIGIMAFDTGILPVSAWKQIPINTWFIAQMWYSGTVIGIRVDKGTAATQAAVLDSGTPASSYLRIGRSTYGVGTTGGYGGRLGQFRRFNYVVAEADLDDIVDELNGTSSPLSRAFNKQTQPAFGDILDTPNGPFTAILELYPTTIDRTQTTPIDELHLPLTADGWVSVFLRNHTVNGLEGGICAFSGSGATSHVCAVTGITLNTRQTLTVTWDGTQFSARRNKGTAVTLTPGVALDSFSHPLSVGGLLNAPYIGVIGQIRIFRRVLTTNEIHLTHDEILAAT